MKVESRLIRLVAIIYCCIGCSSTDDLGAIDIGDCDVTVKFDGTSIRFCSSDPEALDRVQDEFIWQSMNLYYYRQEEVEDLADDRFASYEELYEYLNDAGSSEELFTSLLDREDPFSMIWDDFEVLDDYFQGITQSFGYELGFINESAGSEKLLAYVAYVVSGGPADLAGLQRGDIISKVNGTSLTINNYESLLYGSSSYTLSLIELENGEVVDLERTANLFAAKVRENPILHHEVLNLGEARVGYLAYSQFVNNNESHRELNNIFGQFKSEGITELVLDLRYNPGGSLTTTRILASMIAGETSASDDFGLIMYNDKLAPHFDRPVKFLESLPIIDDNQQSEEELNRLDMLSRVFVLTSEKTASTSELLVIGLDPYVDVVTIGTTTTGKNEGSLPLYDSKNSLYLSNEGDDLSSDHKYAIVPVVSKLANSLGFSVFEQGITPNFVIDERNFLEELMPLGSIDEPLLAEAISIIQGTARKNIPMISGEIVNYKEPKRLLLEKILIEAQYVPEITE